MEEIQLDFAIIGVQKSATTFLQDCLSEHPDIFMPRGETPTFLSDHYEPHLRSLRQALQKEPNQQKCGIKRPDLLTEKGCAQRIHKHFPNCKLIAILRNPIERAYSAYFHLMSIGYIPVLKPEIGFQKLLDGSFHEIYPKSTTILSYGLYFKSLSRYLQLFNAENILILLHDDLKKDVNTTLHKAYSFIDVGASFFPTNKIETRPRSSIYSLARQKLIQLKNRQIYSFSADGLSYGRKSHVSTFNWKLYGVIEKFDNNILKPLLPNNKHLLNRDIIMELKKYYEDDINNLESLIGRDLSLWKAFLENKVG